MGDDLLVHLWQTGQLVLQLLHGRFVRLTAALDVRVVSVAEFGVWSLFFRVVLVVVVVFVRVRGTAVSDGGVVGGGNVFVEEGGQVHVGVLVRGVLQLATAFVIVMAVAVIMVTSVPFFGHHDRFRHEA